MPGGSLGFRQQHGEQRLAVRDPGQPVVRRPRLELQERPGGGVEGARQPPFGGDACLLHLDGIFLGERRFEHSREPIQPPAHVAPGDECCRGHAGQCGKKDRAENPWPAESLDARGEDEHHAGTKGDRQRREKPKGPGESKHAFLCGAGCVRTMKARAATNHGLIVTRCKRSPAGFRSDAPKWSWVQYPPGTFFSPPHEAAPRRGIQTADAAGRGYHAGVPRSGRRL